MYCTVLGCGKKPVELAREKAKKNRDRRGVEKKGYEIRAQGMRLIARGIPGAGRVVPDWSMGMKEGIGGLIFGCFFLVYL